MEITVKIETIKDAQMLHKVLTGISANLNKVTEKMDSNCDEAELKLWEEISSQKDFCNTMLLQLNQYIQA